jgi:RNA polymerase sigma-70 factor, ECF subfamily
LDLILLHSCLAGNEDAFAALYENYKNLVYRTAYLVLDNAGDAEDVLQDVFVLVHRSLSGYNPDKGSFTSWLHRITVNQCLNRRRRPGFFNPSLEDVPESSLRAPELSEEKRAEIEEVRQALSTLNIRQRTIVTLRYYWDLSYAEMAEILGLPLGTVKSRLHQSLQNLQTALKADPATPSLSISEVTK